MLLLGNGVKGLDKGKECGQILNRQHVGTVAWSLVGIGMYFHEDARNPDGSRSPGQCGDEFPLAAAA